MSESQRFILLLIAAAMLCGWGIALLVITVLTWRRERLTERLVGLESRPAAPMPLSITIRSHLNPGGIWTNWRVLRNILWRINQVCPSLPPSRFLLIVTASATAGYLLVWLMSDAILAAVVVGGIAGAIPFVVVNMLWSHRQRRIELQLSDALDFLARVLQAGHSLSVAMMMAGQELPRPIGEEFQRCYDRHALGLPLEDAIKEMASRVQSADFSFFATAILIQRQSGGNLSETLNNISGMVRSRIRLQQHVRAITAEGRLTGTLLLAFPLLMFLIIRFINPEYSGVLLYEPAGQWCLAVGMVFQVLGWIFIRRIVIVKV